MKSNPAVMALPIFNKGKGDQRKSIIREAKAFSWFACAFLACVFAAPQSLRADVLTENPTQDTYATSGAPTTNNGTSNTLSVFHLNANIQQSFLLFDLSSIPAGSTITSATLTLTRDGTIYGGTDGGLNTDIFRVTTPWAQSQATWNVATTGPTVSWGTPGGDFVGTTGVQNTSPYASNRNASGATVYTIAFDVSTLVGQWVAGTYPNDGFAADAASGNNIVFASNRFATSTEWPSLSIDYTAPVPEPSAALLAGVGATLVGVKLLRRRDQS